MTIYTHIHEAASIAGILLSCFYIFKRSLDYFFSIRYKVVSVVWCLLLSLLHTVRPHVISFSVACFIICVISLIFLLLLTKLKLDTLISAFLLSYGISFVMYYIATIPIGFVLILLENNNHEVGSIIEYNTPVYLLLYSLVSILQLALSCLFFRIKRFNKGFPFLFKGYAIIVSFIVTGAVLILTTWGKSIVVEEDPYSAYLYLAGILIIGVGVFIWVKRSIKAAYIRWAKDNNAELYEQKLAEKEREIQRVTELFKTLQAENHSINHRLAALERGYVAMLQKPQSFSTEIAQEMAVSLEDVRRAARDYQEGVGQAKQEIDLPSTKVKMLDELFGLFAERCVAAKIEFNLIINGSIRYMLENIIPQSELETMVGDHLQDAIIAVNASDNPFRSITVTLGLADDCYALTVYDSGIPFTVDTLTRLGTERVTTHADVGGNGIGFMKTFEIMREHGASLVIDEKEPGTEGYSKSVSIHFDDKNQYIISTYRPNAFPVSDKYEVL